MSADELNTSTGSSVDLADGLLDAAEASASQDRVTYLLDDNGRRYAAIVPVEAADEYQARFDLLFRPLQQNAVVADPYSDRPQLVRSTRVRFGTRGEGSSFDVEIDGDDLTVSVYDLGGRHISVSPRSANSVILRMVKP